MSPNIPGNIFKHSGECLPTFRGISSNILGNVAKHSRECRLIFRGISPNIPGNVAEHSGECPMYFDGRELVEASSITVVFSVALLTYGLVDFLAVSEAKLDNSFPTEHFNLAGFRTAYRKDLSAKSG